MLLLGVLLLSTVLAVDVEPPTFHAKIFIENGKVDVLDPLKETEILTSGWSAVNTTKYSIYGEEFTPVDLRGRNITSFTEGWYHLTDFSFDVLRLSNNEIVEITSEILNDLPPSLVNIELENNKIERLRNGIIDNEHLMRINFTMNSIREIESGTFSKTQALRNLNLNYNQLANTEFAATLPPSLRVLSLTGNAITEISSDCFSKLVELQFLSLSQNQITTIHRQTFKGLQNLKFLFLSYNPLQRVENKSFEYTPLIKQIVVGRGQVKDVNDLSIYYNQTIMMMSNEPVIDLTDN